MNGNNKIKITPKKIMLLIFTISLIVIFWRFENLLYFPDSSIVLQKGELMKLRPNSSITQNFIVKRNGLSKVEILLRSPGIKFENGDQIKAEILDEKCENEIRFGEIEDSFLDSSNLYEFKFKRIENSKDKKLCLKLTFLPQKDNAKSIQIFTVDETGNSNLSIRPVYKNENIFKDFSELNRRMSQYKPWFLKHYFLWFISIGFVIFSILLIVVLILL